MIVEMVASEVCESNGFETDAGEAVLGEGVAAGFGNHIFSASF